MRPPSTPPEGFDLVGTGRGWLWVRSELPDSVRGAMSAPWKMASEGAKRYRGRGRPVSVDLGECGRGVLRQYRHGGVFRRVTGTLFVGSGRPKREVAAADRARAAGVSVAEVLAAAAVRKWGVFYQGYILTREVEGARDLVEILLEEGDPRSLLERLGAEVRRMHDAGVWHADLHVKNVLVSEGELTLIDFDRARIHDEMPDALRRANLIRFDRSLEKLDPRGELLSVKDRLRFFRGYYRRGLERGQRTVLLGECRRSHRRHRWWWRLGGRG